MSVLSIVAAVAQNGVIGKENRLPWRIPQELRRFRQLTMGKPVLMGRATFESIGKPLDGRRNLVVSRNPDFRAAPGGEVYTEPASALAAAAAEPEVMLIGGEQLYRCLFPQTDRIYLTEVLRDYDGDAYFPDFVRNDWRVVRREHFAAQGDIPGYRCLLLERA